MRTMPRHPPTAPIPIVIALAFALFVAACDAAEPSSNETPEPTTTADLAGTNWVLRSIGGVEPIGEPTIGFGPDGTSGSTGCNTFRGQYAIDGSSLVLSPLATTKRACLEQALTDQETALLEAFTGVTSWEVGGDGRLTLRGTVELVFEPASQ